MTRLPTQTKQMTISIAALIRVYSPHIILKMIISCRACSKIALLKNSKQNQYKTRAKTKIINGSPIIYIFLTAQSWDHFLISWWQQNYSWFIGCIELHWKSNIYLKCVLYTDVLNISCCTCNCSYCIEHDFCGRFRKCGRFNLCI